MLIYLKSKFFRIFLMRLFDSFDSFDSFSAFLFCGYPAAARYLQSWSVKPSLYVFQKFTTSCGNHEGNGCSTASPSSTPSPSRLSTPIWKSLSCRHAVRLCVYSNSSVPSFPRLRTMASAVETCPALFHPGCVIAKLVMSYTLP